MRILPFHANRLAPYLATAISLGGAPSLAAQKPTCYGPELARNAVRAMALVSNRAAITDLMGGAIDDGLRIWANYRPQNYADVFEVKVDDKACRVTSFTLVAAHQPIPQGAIACYDDAGKFCGFTPCSEPCKPGAPRLPPPAPPAPAY